MTIGQDREVCTSTALYLRCYPYDSWQMETHRRALEDHAEQLGVRHPRVYLDNGASSRTIRPQLRLLLARASMGQISTVLIPGRWVLSLDARTADAVVEFLRSTGARVEELPGHAAPGEYRVAS
ncbi:recombinase family protein [Kitasatospora sp. NPDC049285]|uniref:recombinase family protein n=1 Tax=Kitasatospora sp. NPDC049285 TaxID=3157096 RepID=UPI00344167AB